MLEIPLSTLHLDTESETSHLWRLMKNPQALQRAVQNMTHPREVEIWKKVITNRRSNGTVSSKVTPEGTYRLEVGYREDKGIDSSTYVEETLHILQELLNPIYFRQTEREARVQQQLAQFGLEELPLSLSSIYTSSFLQNLENVLVTFAEAVGVEALRQHFLSKRELITRFFTLSLNSQGLHIDKATIIHLTAILEKWRFSLFPTEARELLEAEEQLRITHFHQSMSLPADVTLDDRRALNNIQIAQREPLETNITRIMEEVAENIALLSDEEIDRLFVQLALQPVMTVENYAVARAKLFNSDPQKIRAFLIQYIQTTDGIRLEKMHYLLRPDAYSRYKISSTDWLNTHDEDVQRTQSLERLAGYADISLPELLLQLADAELSQLWVEGLTEHAILTHPMFWDVAEDSTLPTNPEYIRQNVEAIRAAIASGEVQLPSLLTQAPHMKKHQFHEVPQEIVRQDDAHAALLIDQIDTERNAHKTYRFDTWEIIGEKVGKYIQAAIEILIHNPSVPSLQYLIDRLVGIGHLLEEFHSTDIMNGFLIELVAKSIKMYLLDEKESLGDIRSDGYTFLLTSHKPRPETRVLTPPESIWEELIDSIINTLKNTEDDGKLILQLIQAKNLQEVAEIVGYEL